MYVFKHISAKTGKSYLFTLIRLSLYIQMGTMIWDRVRMEWSQVREQREEKKSREEGERGGMRDKRRRQTLNIKGKHPHVWPVFNLFLNGCAVRWGNLLKMSKTYYGLFIFKMQLLESCSIKQGSIMQLLCCGSRTGFLLLSESNLRSCF